MVWAIIHLNWKPRGGCLPTIQMLTSFSNYAFFLAPYFIVYLQGLGLFAVVLLVVCCGTIGGLIDCEKLSWPWNWFDLRAYYAAFMHFLSCDRIRLHSEIYCKFRVSRWLLDPGLKMHKISQVREGTRSNKQALQKWVQVSYTSHQRSSFKVLLDGYRLPKRNLLLQSIVVVHLWWITGDLLF